MPIFAEMLVNSIKEDIRALTLLELESRFLEAKQPKFRGKQVYDWLWNKGSRTFEEMSNLPKELRLWLNENFLINSISIAHHQKSNDGTIKCGFQLFDNKIVEGVLIPTSDRMTACISSQVGCSLTCKFCATGKMARLRNLEPGEIYDQVVEIKRQAEMHFKIPLTNIVYMGMGEPLLNYANVLASIEKITSPVGLGMASRRITVSTAGIAKMIKKLGDDEVKFNLALSLHAANDEKRSKIMPINESNTLGNLAEALRYFYLKTGTRPTYEYIIFKNFNDTLVDAAELAEFCKVVPSKVNVIEYNPIEGGEFQKADDEKIESFCRFLERKGIVVNVRRSRGKDIDAACGQLANKV
jgi:23S rRNA (adenine2503-C2)-methyltransferase